MRYTVDIQTRAEGSLEGDNLKGERRWERQAARALLDAGREVGSVSDSWARPDSPRWQGACGWAGRTLITQADPGNVRYKPGAAFFLSNVFCGLDTHAEGEIYNAIRDMGRERVFLTHSFQVHVALKRLPAELHDRIRWLPAPAVPRVRRDIDTFANRTLLWSARAISFRMNNPLQSIINLLDWIRETLRADPGLTFEVLASEERMDQAAADAYVWGFPTFAAALSDVRSQVKIHPSISWAAVQDVFARTKLVVNDPTAFGGPPIEAASLGIPVPGVPCSSFHTTSPDKALWREFDQWIEGQGDRNIIDHWNEAPRPSSAPAFPEFVSVGDNLRGHSGRDGLVDPCSLVDILDLWNKDADAYRKAGDGYRSYVERTYTYAAFVAKLDEMIGPWT